MSQSYRLKISRPALKLKVNAQIPAQLVGGAGISITRAGGTYSFALDTVQIGGMFSLLFQPVDPELTALSSLIGAADTLAYFTGPGAMALAGFTATARSLLAGASASAMRTTLGLNRVITPEMYGAVGDGATDDSVALQSFLDACAASNAIGVFAPGKTYIFGAQAGGLYVKDKTYLIGHGATLKAKVTAPLNYSSLNVTDATQGAGAGPSNVYIYGLTINGNATARRAGGAFSGVGNAASFYCVNAAHVYITDCQSIDSEADGFYFGGDSSTGGPGFYFGFTGCYATGSSRNAYSLVGGNHGSLVNCIAAAITYGASQGNISMGFDFEPNGATSKNLDITLTGCKAISCTTAGFAENFNAGNQAFSTNISLISPHAESCGVGYYCAFPGTDLKIVNARNVTNTTNFRFCAESILDGQSDIRNRFENGCLDIWQIGTGSTSCPIATRTYLADRIFVNPAGAAVTQQRSTATLSAASTTSNAATSRYSLLLTGAASVTTVNVGQRIEAAEAAVLSGVVSFQVKILNSTGGAFTPSLLIGTPAAADDFTTITNRLTQALQSCPNGVWTTVSYTVDISGFTNVLNGIQVELQIPSGILVATKTVNINDFCLERGSNPSIVVPKIPVASELVRCARWLRVIGNAVAANQYLANAMCFSATVSRAVISLGAPMRAAPTGTLSAATDFQIDDAVAGPYVGASSSFITSPDTIQIQLNCTAMTAGRAGFLMAVNTNARIFLKDPQL